MQVNVSNCLIFFVSSLQLKWLEMTDQLQSSQFNKDLHFLWKLCSPLVNGVVRNWLSFIDLVEPRVILRLIQFVFRLTTQKIIFLENDEALFLEIYTCPSPLLPWHMGIFKARTQVSCWEKISTAQLFALWVFYTFPKRCSD